MSENIKLSYVWDHTIKKILNHDLQSKIGNIIKEWVVYNTNWYLCYINENGEMLPTTTLQEFYNLRWYIQHLIDDNEYQYDDDE